MRGRPGAAAALVPLASPRDLSVLKQSPYLLFSQCPLYFLSPIFINTGLLLAVRFVPQ